MTHRIVRCVHCHTEYSYQASGEGCFNPINNEHYCPECMQKIIEALKDVPVKFSKRYNEIEIKECLLDSFKKIKNVSKGGLNLVRYINLPYNNIELYVIDFVEYALCWDKESDKHLYRLDEYDNIKKEFTNKPWLVNSKNGFCLGGTLFKTFKSSDVPVIPLEPPKSTLLFRDIY